MSRSNFAIGIVSSLINVGNGVQPLIVGAILDASKIVVSDGVDNFGLGIKKVCTVMCVLDGIAAVCLLAWVILKPQMLNGDNRKKEEVKQDDKEEKVNDPYFN